jgi:hypothetical protein
MVDLSKSKSHKTGYRVCLNYTLTQHTRDIQLMKNLEQYLGCGFLREDSRYPVIYFTIRKFQDILDKILLFFDKYPCKEPNSMIISIF